MIGISTTMTLLSRYWSTTFWCLSFIWHDAFCLHFATFPESLSSCRRTPPPLSHTAGGEGSRPLVLPLLQLLSEMVYKLAVGLPESKRTIFASCSPKQYSWIPSMRRMETHCRGSWMALRSRRVATVTWPILWLRNTRQDSASWLAVTELSKYKPCIMLWRVWFF